MDDNNNDVTGQPGDDSSGDTGDDSSGGAGTGVFVQATLMGEFHHVFECVHDVSGVTTNTLLRSFRVEEGDLAHYHSDMTRQLIGKRVVVNPDGNADFACYLSSVIALNIRHHVRVWYDYDS